MYQTSAPCIGGSQNGGVAAVSNPGGDGPLHRGATSTVMLDESAHVYHLAPIAQHPFQVFNYEGVPVKAPTDIVDLG